MPAAVALLPLRRRRRVAAVAVFIAATLVVVVATAVTAVAAVSWTPWLKIARVGRWREDGRQQNKQRRLWLRLQYAQNCRYDDVGR